MTDLAEMVRALRDDVGSLADEVRRVLDMLWEPDDPEPAPDQPQPAPDQPAPAPEQPADIEILCAPNSVQVMVYLDDTHYRDCHPDFLAPVIKNLLAKLDAKPCITIVCPDSHIARLVWGVVTAWPSRYLLGVRDGSSDYRGVYILLNGELLSDYPRGEDDAT